jgi:hypothetical protein
MVGAIERLQGISVHIGVWYDWRCLNMAAPLECGSGTGAPTPGADGVLSVAVADGLASINQLIVMVSSERMLSISAKVVAART